MTKALMNIKGTTKQKNNNVTKFYPQKEWLIYFSWQFEWSELYWETELSHQAVLRILVSGQLPIQLEKILTIKSKIDKYKGEKVNIYKR